MLSGSDVYDGRATPTSSSLNSTFQQQPPLILDQNRPRRVSSTVSSREYEAVRLFLWGFHALAKFIVKTSWFLSPIVRKSDLISTKYGKSIDLQCYLAWLEASGGFSCALIPATSDHTNYNYKSITAMQSRHHTSTECRYYCQENISSLGDYF